MDDHNSPEAVEARANQEDPIVMYLVVRESLGMSIGKTAAQAAHASQMLVIKYFNEVIVHTGGILEGDIATASDKLKLFKQWLDTSFRKVTLRADDKEWEKIKAEIPETHRIIVVDAGLTEIASGSETVIGLWPMCKSARPKVIKRCQVLK